MIENKYRILVVGPTGAGKSQFCNFAINDLTNSKNKVSDSLDSCTQDPQSNEFQRLESSFDFIDTAGNSDSDDNDLINLEKLVNYLKILKNLHYIILVLKFGERLTSDTRQYIETLGKIFTTSEFFCHLCIVFTKFPNEPSEKDLKTMDKFNSEINKLLRKIFKIDKNENLPDNDIYFIDTSIDDKNKDFNQKNQDTIDIILKQIRHNMKLFHPINTVNLDMSGNNVKLRRAKEIEIIKRQLEEEKKRAELEKKRAIEEKKKAEMEKKRLEEERKENERRLREIEKAKEEEKKRKEKEYQEFKKRQEEERKKREEERQRLEKINKENEVQRLRNIEIAKELQKEQDLINEEKKRKNIRTENLNKYSEAGIDIAKFGGIGLLGSIGLGLIGAAITPFCPIAGPCLIGAAIGGGTAGTAEIAGGGITYGIAEYKKSQIE